MYNGNCAIKLDSHEDEMKTKMDINAKEIDLWLKEHHTTIQPIEMGSGDYVVGVCFPG